MPDDIQIRDECCVCNKEIAIKGDKWRDASGHGPFCSEECASWCQEEDNAKHYDPEPGVYKEE